MSSQLNLIAFVLFACSMFVRSPDPVIPQIAGDMAIDPVTVALLTTAFTLPYALVQPLFGALADMFSKSRMMLICLLTGSVATFICGFATSFEVLVVARVVAGLATGGVMPIAFALVGDKFPIAERQVAMGRLLFAIMSGNLLGATFSGVIGDLVGWRGVFFVTGAFAVIALIAATPGLRGFAQSTGRFDLSTVGPNYRTIFSNPLAKICYTVVFLEAVFMYGLFPHIATLMHDSGETRASIAGLVLGGFGIGGALYALSVSRVLPRVGETWLMRAGGVVMGSCLLMVAMRWPWPVEFVTFVLLGCGFYMLHGVIQIYASELAPSARGSAMALHSFFFFMGHAVGPIVYSVGMATVGVTPVLVFGAGVLIVAGFVCAQWLRRSPPTPKPTPTTAPPA